MIPTRDKIIITVLTVLFMVGGSKAIGGKDRNGLSIGSAGANSITALWTNPPLGYQDMQGKVFVVFPDGSKYLFTLIYSGTKDDKAVYKTTDGWNIPGAWKLGPYGQYTIVDGDVGGNSIGGLPKSFCVPDTCPAPYPMPTIEPNPYP